ncbi:Protein disulfide-isomerase A3 [Halotydeus destructor]|nr:Protein disulfide-isomerase A3 [Halotydeus destructor]
MYNMEEKQDITEWVFRKAFGVVLYRTRDSEESIKPPLIVAYYDFDFRTNPKWAHLWRNRLVKASQRHPDVKFAISNSQSFRKQLRRQSLEPPKGDDKPIFVGYDNFGTLYLMRDEYTKDAFEQFIVEYKNGDVSPHLRSQEPPVNADKMAVKVAVGGNFHKLVTTNKKDVFIVLYAPWCKHSQELEPVWEELGRQLEAERELDIVKMDAVANEVPSQFEVPQYPTIYFVPKDTKKALRYTGGRYIHEFVQFLAKHATNELALFERDGTLRKAKKSEL